MVKKLPEDQIKYIESLLPELRDRVQKSYEQASKMTGKAIESYGRVPDLTVPRGATEEDEKPKRTTKPRGKAKSAATK